ncbi:hypothetical protein CPB86DRAFT_818296 [Serendipita vermifera]|nr:hypothetical protein CPB86DRAFT_818296 [Serendipita vermifera]
MQPSDQTEFTEVILESRIPISTLRSTASPYKQGYLRSTMFNQYLAELTSLNSRTRLDLVERFVGQSEEKKGLGTSTSSQQSNVSTENASVSTNSTSIQSWSINSSPSIDLDAKYAYKAPSEAPSSPFAVPSSPSSYAADFSSELDIEHDGDDITESDHLEISIPPVSDKENSSPFSSPLSTAPDSPLSQTKVVFSSLDTTISAPQSPLQQSPSESAQLRPEEDVLPRATNVKKRARSPSPNRMKNSHQRKPSKRESGDFWKEGGLRNSTSNKDLGIGTSSLPSDVSKELIGSLIQILALSGRSSMQTSKIVEEMLASSPSLRSERSAEEWTSICIGIMSVKPVFGRADSKGLKNADNESIEDEWYYRPEDDEDDERREMLGGFQRGGGKRRATVQKKQYYWKPVR